jgi:PAS domain S-box-containing protein
MLSESMYFNEGNSSTAARMGQTPDAAKGARVKILLVDDTPENLIALEAALETLGEQLVSAHSGKEALRYLLEDNFAAILLDVKMPDMDGFETAELIRSRPRSRHTPILFLTGYKNEEHLFRGYDLGAVDFLFKPIVPEVLRSKVAVFVELSRKADLLEQQAAVLRSQTATLQKAEQRFRSLLEAAPDAMIICHASGNIALVNSRAETIFGYRRAELLDQHIHALVPRWRFDMQAYSEEEPGYGLLMRGESSELDGVCRDGSTFPVEISLSPLEVDGGVLVITAIRDITARKRVEDERARAEEEVRQLNADLAQLNGHLEARVRERTEALLRSNDELAQFAYIASHDLQEPLRTISLYTQLLASRIEDVPEPEVPRFMRYITENAARMEQMIRDVLEFSRVEADGADYLRETSCDGALDEALVNLQARIEECDAKIDRGPLPSVHGDATQLSRLFLNLVINSIKYRHPDRTPEIRVAAEPLEAGWIFSVRDNGIGIEAEYLERIFGIFKRLHGRDNPGTGMGLAICKKIVTRHGGRIWVESTPEVGSTFFFTIGEGQLRKQ